MSFFCTLKVDFLKKRAIFVNFNCFFASIRINLLFQSFVWAWRELRMQEWSLAFFWGEDVSAVYEGET